MIVVDTSALIAVLFREPDCDTYRSAMFEADGAFMSAASVLEASMKLVWYNERAMDDELDLLLQQLQIQPVAIELDQLAVARRAFRSYGKGTGHPARLNFGDCFSYALAKTRNLPLLYKGNDFIHTDICSAL